MLVLSRKVGESILLGENIRVTVLPGKGGEIKLGIDAPSEVRVLRAELVEGRADAGSPSHARRRS